LYTVNPPFSLLGKEEGEREGFHLIIPPPLSAKSGWERPGQVSWLPDPCLTAPSQPLQASGFFAAGSPVTVAGPHRIHTGFPFKAESHPELSTLNYIIPQKKKRVF